MIVHCTTLLSSFCQIYNKLFQYGMFFTRRVVNSVNLDHLSSQESADLDLHNFLKLFK